MKHLAFTGLVALVALILVPMCIIRVDLANWPFGDNNDVLLIALFGGTLLGVAAIIALIALIVAWVHAVIWCWKELTK